MREQDFIPHSGRFSTLHEKWNIGPRNRHHWYNASTEFATRHLGDGNGRSCLVIGSPIFEAKALQDKGWDITYLDIRRPPVIIGKFILCDATDINLEDESFDAVSSACVLTHAGTGRYGDKTNNPHGDEQMLSHIARVMKSGGMAAITFGAVADIQRMTVIGNLHRVYTVPECERMLAAASLKVGEMKVWGKKKSGWLETTDAITQNINSPDYISFMVTK